MDFNLGGRALRRPPLITMRFKKSSTGRADRISKCGVAVIASIIFALLVNAGVWIIGLTTVIRWIF